MTIPNEMDELPVGEQLVDRVRVGQVARCLVSPAFLRRVLGVGLKDGLD